MLVVPLNPKKRLFQLSVFSFRYSQFYDLDTTQGNNGKAGLSFLRSRSTFNQWL